MSTNYEFQQLFDESICLYGEYLSAKDKLSEHMDNFLVGFKLGADLLNDSLNKGPDIILPNDVSEYNDAIALINKDIDIIEELEAHKSKISDLVDIHSLGSQLVSRDPSQRGSIEEVSDLFDRLDEEKEAHEELLREIVATRDLIQDLDEVKDAETIADGGDTSTASHATSSSGSGNSPITYSIMESMNDYSPILKYDISKDLNLSDAKSSLDELGNNSASFLKYVCLEKGISIGASVYNIPVDPDAPEVILDMGALYLSMDSVYAKMSLMEQYILQAKETIAENLKSIELKQAQMKETIQVPMKDENGYVYGYYEVPKYDNDRLSLEIVALQEDNNNLEADIEKYEKEYEEREDLLATLYSVYCSVNLANEGLVNVFVANDLIAELSNNGPNANFYGVSLTDDQKTNIYEVLRIRK